MLAFCFERRAFCYSHCATSQSRNPTSTRKVLYVHTVLQREPKLRVKLMRKEKNKIRFQADTTHSGIIKLWSTSSNSQNRHKSQDESWKIQMNLIPKLLVITPRFSITGHTSFHYAFCTLAISLGGWQTGQKAGDTAYMDRWDWQQKKGNLTNRHTRLL